MIRRVATLRSGVRFPAGVARFQSTIPNRRPAFKELFQTSTTKSLLLTILFGSLVTELIARRKKLESLHETHTSKMIILTDILQRLKDGEDIDLQKEFKLLNTTDDTDEQLEKLFSLIDEPVKEGDSSPSTFL